MITKNILIVHCDGLGDAVFAVPFLSILPRYYPGANFYIICGTGRKELYLGLKFLIILETKEKIKISELLTQEFEVVFDLNGGSKHVTDYFRGIVLKYKSYIGFRKGSIIRNEIPININSDVPRWKEFLRFIPGDKEISAWDGYYNPVTTRASKDLCGLLLDMERSCMLICVAPGSKIPEKRWPTEFFAEVIGFFKKEYNCRIALIGNYSEIRLGEELEKFLCFPIDNLIGISPLGCAIEVLKKSKFVLANDSGLFHLSCLMKIPALGLYGPTDHNKWSLCGTNDNILKSPTGRMEDILPSRVINKCAEMIKI